MTPNDDPPPATPAAPPIAAATVRAPDFAPGLAWVQAGGAAPTLADLRGRVAVVDVWTYGCINCQHVVPELRALERRFAAEAAGGRLAVVGVHSGKFIAERATERIAHAAARLGAGHPVANDRQFRTWRAWAARGWPTLAVVDARGYVRYQHAGERRASELAQLVGPLLAEAADAGADAPGPLPWAGAHAPAASAPGPDALRYPSAVAAGPVAPDGTRPFALADAGHHRVLVGRLAADGRTFAVRHAVGTGARTRDGCAALDAWTLAPGQALDRATFVACADGSPDQASFDRPQGLAWWTDDDGANVLYVADTGNHAVRAVDPDTGMVRTVAGTGARLRTRGDRRAGALASPWGVLAFGSGDGGPVLLVAMAGTHELWRVDPDTGMAGPVAGGRGEALIDGAPADALLAQPAGLTSDGARIWWTDAESSAVRECSSAALGVASAVGGHADEVRTVVGTGLFDFGHADGAGDDVRFQHPQGIAWVSDGSSHGGGKLLVADSYNDALRWVDPVTREARTWRDGFSEPGGVCVAGDLAYVADTNAHRVAVVELRTGAVDTLALRDDRR